jgi:hypothetical protein
MIAVPPISRKRAAEFFDAVREYVRWAGPQRKPLLFDRYIQLSLACGRVAHSTDLLPHDVFDMLHVLAIDDAHAALKEELRLDRTYATAARILQELIDANKETIGKSS